MAPSRHAGRRRSRTHALALLAGSDEPILDGTANLLYVRAAMAEGAGVGNVSRR